MSNYTRAKVISSLKGENDTYAKCKQPKRGREGAWKILTSQGVSFFGNIPYPWQQTTRITGLAYIGLACI